MNIELMRAKMKEKELHHADEQQECSKSYTDRILATLKGTGGNCSVVNEKFSLWLYSILGPYLLGFILITILCLSLVDISLGTYFTILAEHFSVFGLWTIGYFLLSILFLVYMFTTYALNRS